MKNKSKEVCLYINEQILKLTGNNLYFIRKGTRSDYLKGIDLNMCFNLFFKNRDTNKVEWLGTFYMCQENRHRIWSPNDHITMDIDDSIVIVNVFKKLSSLKEHSISEIKEYEKFLETWNS